MLPLTGHVTIIPNVLDFTHVQNTGAAFGLLNAADFPYKSGVMIVIAALALIAISLYARQLGSHERLSRYGLALILGGAFGNLIDRPDVRLRRSTSSTCIGTRRISGRSTWPTRPSPSGPCWCFSKCWASDGSMHPILFEVGGFTIYSYGVLLAAAYLLGLQFARARARARGLDAQRVMDLGIWIIISALVGAKLLLFLVDFREFTASPRDLMGLAAIRRRVLRRADRRRGGRVLVHVAVPACRSGRRRTCSRPGIALGHAVGRMGCLLAGCCFGRPTSEPWGITFHSTVAAANVGTPLGVPLHPTQIYEAVAELIILGAAAGDRTSRTRVRRTDVLDLPAAVRRLAVHHRDLSRRQSRARPRCALDVAVRVGDPGPARDPDALPAAAASGSPRRSRRRAACARHERRPSAPDGRRRPRRGASRRLPRRGAARPIALANPAVDQGRPRDGPRRAATAQHARPRRPTLHDHAATATSRTLRHRRTFLSPSCIRTPTSSCSTSRPEWSSTPRPGMPAARSSTRCSTMWTT